MSEPKPTSLHGIPLIGVDFPTDGPVDRRPFGQSAVMSDPTSDVVQRVVRYIDSQPLYRASHCLAMETANERARATGVRQRVEVGMRRPAPSFVIRPVDSPRTKR